jgi:hypothetical protein
MQEKRPRSTTISSTTVTQHATWSTWSAASAVLPLWACAGSLLQDAPDYHLRVGAVVRAVLDGVRAYCGPLNVENISKSRKRALLGHYWVT